MSGFGFQIFVQKFPIFILKCINFFKPTTIYTLHKLPINLGRTGEQIWWLNPLDGAMALPFLLIFSLINEEKNYFFSSSSSQFSLQRNHHHFFHIDDPFLCAVTFSPPISVRVDQFPSHFLKQMRKHNFQPLPFDDIQSNLLIFSFFLSN